MLLLLLSCTSPPEPEAPAEPHYVWDVRFDLATSTWAEPVPWPGTVGEAPVVSTHARVAGDFVLVGGPDGLAHWIGKPSGPDWVELQSVAGAPLGLGTVTRDVLPALSRGEPVRVPAELVLSRQRVPMEVALDGASARLVGLPEGLGSTRVPPWGFAVWGATGTVELYFRLYEGKLRFASREVLVDDLEQLRRGLTEGCIGTVTAERDVIVGSERWIARWRQPADRKQVPLRLVDPGGAEHEVTREMPVGVDRGWVAGDVTLTLVNFDVDWAGHQSWRPLFVEPSWITGCSFAGPDGLQTCELGELRVTHESCERVASIQLARADFVPKRMVLANGEALPLGSIWAQRAGGSGNDDRIVLDDQGRAGWLVRSGTPHVVLPLGEAPQPPLPWLTDAQLEALLAGQAVAPEVEVVLKLPDGDVRVRLDPREAVQLPGRDAWLTLDTGSYGHSLKGWLRGGIDLQLHGAPEVVDGRVVIALRP